MTVDGKPSLEEERLGVHNGAGRQLKDCDVITESVNEDEE